MPFPLAGSKALDLTIFMAGPYCSMVLGDLGGEGIKIGVDTSMSSSRRSKPC